MIQALPVEMPIEMNSDQAQLPHVLLVVDQLPQALGGGERILLKLAALLPNYGFRASILTFMAHPESAALKNALCPIYLLPLNCTYDLTALRGAMALRQFIQQQKIQIVHTFFESSDLWAGAITKTTRAKLVWSRRDMGILRGRKHQIAYRLMAKAPNAVFAVSELVRQHCIEVDRIDAVRVQTVYNGLDRAAWKDFHRPVKDAEDFLITTVGNIRRVKGHDLFIKAAAAVTLAFPNCRFSIAGAVLEPDYYAELLALVKELNLSNRFSFAGGVSDLRSHLSNADLFVLPSRSEGFSNAIIEAMASGLPVIATDVGGNAEAVQHGVSGLIVPTENVAALSEAMLQLITDPKQASAMGDAGKMLVAEKFTTDAMMSRIVHTFQTLLEGQ